MAHEPHRITEPLIVPASLDPDAVKILRRLHRYGHEAYLVGGCVRDLSLGRIPKDFDIATGARPRQVKRLFRNSRIIGRRFKLVHVQFGDKIIEVSTFRRSPGQSEFEDDPDRDLDDAFDDGDDGEDGVDADLLIRRDNVFGSAEEDAVRRDFTINGLFYDLEENEVLDFVGGAADLEDRYVRTIGDPNIRFQEDPVRILRAIRFAARLDFDIEERALAAMIRYHADLSKCPSPRVTEELLKILSCGASRRALELLEETGALRIVLPEVASLIEGSPRIEGWSKDVRAQLCRYLDVVDELDHGRRILSNAVLLTVLLNGSIRRRAGPTGDPAQVADAVVRPFAARMSISRRDAFRVKQILIAQPRLKGDGGSRRRRRVRPQELVRREYFRDALEFLRIETEVFDLPREDVDRWTALYFDELRREDPKKYRRAVREAPFGVPSFDAPPPDETEETPVAQQRRRKAPGQGDGEGAAPPEEHEERRASKDDGDADAPRSRRRRGGRGRGKKSADGPAHDASDARGESAEERPAAGDSREEVASGRRRRRGAAQKPDREERAPKAERDDSGDERSRRARPRDEREERDARDARDDRDDREERDARGDRGDRDDRDGGESRRRRGRRGGRRSRASRDGDDRDRDDRDDRDRDDRDRDDRDDRDRDDRDDRDRDDRDRDDDARAERGRRDDDDGDAPRKKRSRRRGRKGRGDRDEARSRDRDDDERDRDPSRDDDDGDRREGKSRRGRRGRKKGGERRDDASGKGGGRNARRGDDEDGRRRRGGRRGKKDRDGAPGGSGGQRLEFDEVRAGPLKRPEAGELLDDEGEEEEVEVRWDDPLPKVGDPGPISVIRTGIDQTEKSSARRARKKKDPAKRELAKEILDQPALQALKMSEGDPRGHEVTRPRVLRRAERERRDAEANPPPREKPFDPIEDFESIESLFRW